MPAGLVRDATVEPAGAQQCGSRTSGPFVAASTITFEWRTANPVRTTVEFEVEHFWGLHTVPGRFHRFDGVYVVGTAGPEIELTIDTASIDTGSAARERHLRSADFFDVDEHPQVRFTSTQVTGIGNGQVRVRTWPARACLSRSTHRCG